MKNALDQHIGVIAIGYRTMAALVAGQDKRLGDLLDELGEKPMPGEARREAIARLNNLSHIELVLLMYRNGLLGGGHGKA